VLAVAVVALQWQWQRCDGSIKIILFMFVGALSLRAVGFFINKIDVPPNIISYFVYVMQVTEDPT
jgi:hypothetical protein